MKIETLKRSDLKRNIIIGVAVVAIISAIVLNFTKAKYRTTQSIPLVNGTINYSLPDLNIIGLYIDGEEATELDSNKTYTLDTTQSTCTYKDGTEIPDLSISYDGETKELQISPFTTRGTKCTLYFEEYKIPAKDIILGNKTISTRSSFSSTLTTNTTGTIYQAEDDDGITYYFAGNPNDNWVQWAGFYWRIIRINGDETIRMIYQGTSANTVGEDTQTSVSAFNGTNTDNMHVGFKYTANNPHGAETNSTILGILDEWYEDNLTNYAEDIDENAGFCNDRMPYSRSGSSGSYTYTSGGGTGKTRTYYAAYTRLYTRNAAEISPSFKCTNNSDLFTVSGASKGNRALQYPIGLITADEVAFAGGVYGETNQSYYLYTNSIYWTMSPVGYLYGTGATLFFVNSSGFLNINNAISTYGVRPVINLRSDVTISSGNGTSINPYIIN